MRITRALVPLVPLVLAGTVLAGCGGDSDSTPADTPSSVAATENGVAAAEPKEILDKATAALSATKSYSVKGEVSNDGEKFGIDAKVAGEDLLGTLTLDAAKIELLRVAGGTYIRPDAAFWKENAGEGAAAVTQLVGNRWVKTTDGDVEFQMFFEIFSSVEMLKMTGTLSKGDAKTINGVEAIGVVEAGADGATLYVATTGEPYPLVIQPTSGSGQLTFGDFGATFDDVKAPAAGDTIDLSKVMSN